MTEYIGGIPAPAPGFYENVPFDVYLSWDAISASFLKGMDHTPGYGKWKHDHPVEEAKHYAKGRLFHTLSLEPEKADEEYIVKPATYTNEKDEEKKWNGNAKPCKAWMAANADRTVIGESDMADAKGMALRARAAPQLHDYLTDAYVELCIVWIDEATGLPCKGRIDAYKNGFILDLKSTSGSAAAFAWYKESARLRAHIQAAHYISGVKAVGLWRKGAWFRFAVIENYPPFEIRVFDVQDEPGCESLEYLEYGLEQRYILLTKTKTCIETGSWPGYDTESADMFLTHFLREDKSGFGILK